MAKIANAISTYEVFSERVAGHTDEKVSDAMLKKVSKFEKGFPDGVYVKPSSKNEPVLRVKAMYEYCDEKGIKPEDLSVEEVEKFLVYEK